MGLKNDVELQLINFQKAYNSLDTSAEDYDAQLAKLQKDYNLNLDARQILKRKGDPLSLDDVNSVRKRMLLNAKRDRAYAAKDASLTGLEYGVNQIDNIIQSFNNPQANQTSVAKQDNPIKNVFAQANELINGMDLKKTIPENGQKSAPNQFAKQGMKIEYMNLFK